jgi:uncharacterized protein YdeI (YjbR/CyaY-like superfamily)
VSDIPKDFSDALKKSGLEAFFKGYPPSHQREHLKCIAEAKRPETRKKRIENALKMLSEKRTLKAARS